MQGWLRSLEEDSEAVKVQEWRLMVLARAILSLMKEVWCGYFISHFKP